MKTITNQRILLGEDYIEIWVESFLKERTAQNLAKGTVEFYRDKLREWVTYFDSQEIKFISQINPNNLRDFLILLEERGHNSGGIHAFYRSMKTFLRWYWDEMDLETKNPISKVKAPRLTEEPLEGISKEDFALLVSQCKRNNFYGERDRAILLFLVETGVRASELCSINIEDVNFADSSILVRQGKGRKPRFVFFGKSCRKQLRKWLGFRGVDGNALFINKESERIKYNTLREIMRRLSQRAGVEEPGLHDFRRAFCLACLKKGIPEITIARLMGHTTTQLIGRYAKQTTHDLGNAYKSILDE